MKIELYISRRIDVWYYTVGHSTLLVRSLKEKNSDAGERIHIFSTSTRRIDLPMHFQANQLLINDKDMVTWSKYLPSDYLIGQCMVFIKDNYFVGYIHADFIQYCIDKKSMYSMTDLASVNNLLNLTE